MVVCIFGPLILPQKFTGYAETQGGVSLLLSARSNMPQQFKGLCPPPAKLPLSYHRPHSFLATTPRGPCAFFTHHPFLTHYCGYTTKERTFSSRRISTNKVTLFELALRYGFYY